MTAVIGGEYVHATTETDVEVVDFEVGNGSRTGRLVVRPLDWTLPAFVALPSELQDGSGNALEAHGAVSESEHVHSPRFRASKSGQGRRERGGGVR